MATEFRLNYTGSEINRKLETVDEIKSNLNNDYYTSVDIDTKLEEVNTSIEEVGSSLATKADLVDGKVPVEQLPDNNVDLSEYYTKTETDNALSEKADLVDGKVPLEQLPDDIGGGLTEVAWEDVKDKPFYETGTKIEWDGTPTSEFASLEGLGFYKVSDAYIDAESLIGNTVSLCAIETGDTVTVNISSDSIIDLGENCFIISPAELEGMPPVIITSSATSIEGVEFPSAGIWFLTAPDVAYTSCLESVQIKKLDPKFIPNYFYETGFYTDCDASKATAAVIVPANEELGTPEFRYLKFAEPIDDSIQGYLLSTTFDGTTMEIIMGDGEGALITSGTGSEHNMYVLNIKTDNETVNLEDFGIPIFTVVEAGLYIFDMSAVDDSVKFNYFKAPNYFVKQIDPKFIPANLDFDLSDYYTKEETNDIINYIEGLKEDIDTILDEIGEMIGE